MGPHQGQLTLAAGVSQPLLQVVPRRACIRVRGRGEGPDRLVSFAGKQCLTKAQKALGVG